MFDDRKLDIVKKLRLDLLTSVGNDNAEFANKTPLSRKKKADIISDIMILGEYIARPTNISNLDGLFNPDLTHPSTLNEVITLMKSDLEAIKSENRALRLENENLMTRLAKCEATLGLENEDILDEGLLNSSDEADEVDEAEEITEITEVENSCVPLFAASSKASHIPDQSASGKTFVYIGNVNPTCSQKSILQHITKKIKVNVYLQDIHEIPSKKIDKRAFKVAVPQDKLHQVINNLPANVNASQWRGGKNNSTAHKFPMKRNQGQRFRKNYPRSFKHQNEYHNQQDWPPWNYHQPGEYNQNYYYT